MAIVPTGPGTAALLFTADTADEDVSRMETARKVVTPASTVGTTATLNELASPEFLEGGKASDTTLATGLRAVMHRRFAIVNGVRLAYLEREAVSGQNATPTLPPILLLHALLATAETLTELIAGLPAERRIVAIDLPAAQPADGAKTLDVHQASLTELIHNGMKSMGLVQPVLIGHSHGGVLALRLAATYPMALKGLVLMCPAHPFGGYRSRVVNFYLRQPGRMLALSIPLAPSWMILRAYNEAAGSKSPIRMRHLRPHLKVLRSRNTLRRVLDILQTWDEDMGGLREALTKTAIASPALLIWGDEDPVVPIASAAELEEHLADSERVTLAGIGHLLVEEAPEECAKLIGDWLARLDARDQKDIGQGSSFLPASQVQIVG